MSPPETTTSRTVGVLRGYSRICAWRSFCGVWNLSLSTWGTSLPTRSIRVQCPQYWGQVDSSSASTLVGYRWVSPSTTHISGSCRLSREALGWLGHSVSRSARAGAMYRRTGSAHRSAVFMVLTMWGGISIDIVARRSWSWAMLSARSSGSRSPRAALNSRRFLMVWFRCQVAFSQSARETPRNPGRRFQSGSAYSRRGG